MEDHIIIGTSAEQPRLCWVKRQCENSKAAYHLPGGAHTWAWVALYMGLCTLAIKKVSHTDPRWEERGGEERREESGRRVITL